MPLVFVEVGTMTGLEGRKKSCWVRWRGQDDNETFKWRCQVSTCRCTGLEIELWKGIAYSW